MAYPVIPILWIVFWLIGKVVRARQEKVRAKSAPSRSRGGAIWQTSLTGMHYAYLVIGSLTGTAVLVSLASVAPDLGCGTYVAIFVLQFHALLHLPHWLSWRVLGPAGWARAGHGLLRFALYPSKASRKGARGLFAAAYGLPWDLRGDWASPWTVFAVAVEAESEDDPARADVVLAFLEGESPLRLPSRVRTLGVEILAWAAARRGDWEVVLRRTRLGRGRGVLLLRRLAAAHTGEGGSTPLLWLCWLLAPERKKTLPFVRAAGVKETVSQESPAPPLPSLERGPWLFHLHLLSHAAQGKPVPAHAVERLAEAWEERLDAASEARLAARGLELGVREPAMATGLLRETVMAEIQSLAAIAQGEWQTEDGDGLLADLHRRRVDHLYDELEIAMDGFPVEGGMSRDFGTPLEELERWLLLRLAAERLEAEAGFGALQTAWHNGLRIAACNWPVYLERRYGEQAIWACYVMHLWSTEQAVRMGDEEIAGLSRENAWIAASELGKVR